MDKNPRYNVPSVIYDEVYDGIVPTKRQVTEGKLTDTRYSNRSGTFTDTETKRKTKRRCALAVFFSLLALSLVAVAALATISCIEVASLRSQVQQLKQLNGTHLGAYSPEQLTNTEPASLDMIIWQLENQLNQTVQATSTDLQNRLDHLLMRFTQIHSNTAAELSSLQSSVDTLNTDRDTTMDQLSSLQSSVDTDRDTTRAQLSSLQSSVDTVNTDRDTTMDQLSSLQSSVDTDRDTTRAQLSSLQSSVDTVNTDRDTTTDQLNSLQSSVNTLTTRVNSPVNLYQNCIQETRSCTGSQSGSSYI